MVAAAMLVAMAVPAFAQNHLGLLNIGNFAELTQKCKQANVAIADQDNAIGQVGVVQSGLVNNNTGDVNQTAIAVNEVNQANVCIQALDQEFDLFGDEEKNGPPPPPPPPPPPE